MCVFNSGVQVWGSGGEGRQGGHLARGRHPGLLAVTAASGLPSRCPASALVALSWERDFAGGVWQRKPWSCVPAAPTRRLLLLPAHSSFWALGQVCLSALISPGFSGLDSVPQFALRPVQLWEQARPVAVCPDREGLVTPHFWVDAPLWPLSEPA